MHHSQGYFACSMLQHVHTCLVWQRQTTMVNVGVDQVCQAGLIQECTEPPPPEPGAGGQGIVELSIAIGPLSLVAGGSSKLWTLTLCTGSTA